jgi:hypothetical protein
MRKFGLLISAVVAISMQAASADAATFNWSYTDGGSHTGGGTLTATETSPGSGKFNINSISGTAEGEAITGGPFPSYAFTGTAVYWTASAPQVFDPLNPFFFTDFAGFAWSSNSGFFSVYENNASNLYDCLPASAPYCLIGPGANFTSGLDDPKFALTNFQVDLVPGQTPIPGALPLFASGLGLLGFAAHRRKRKQAIAA